MQNLTIGLDIIFPVFLVILTGYFLKLKNLIDDNFVARSTTLVFYVALPAKLFFDIKNSQIEKLDIRYTLYLLLGTLAIFSLSWIIGRLFIKEDRKLSAFVHCAYRSNFIYIGIPILEMIYSGDSMDSVLVVIIFGLTFYNMLSIVLLTYYGGGKLSAKSFLLKIIKNPMIVSVCLGLFAKLINLPIYEGIEEGASLIARLTTPLSLILIGGSLDFKKSKSDNLIIFSSALIKNALGAAVLVPLGYFMGFSNSQLIVAYLFFATPCAVNCFIMGKQMGSDALLTSKIITASFAMSIVTYSVGIALLNYFGII
ncbi:AEC family transporter [Anaerosphaera multitolerans]|uniref:AEC family transporter n=1 Tax=Anaerosphaera multitolerans TaxID=2487351 RepID=A0A437S916_9FIRM|nr:AEC family transporter [Anaerosphaera multitolerans]RVU55599.1 AEC family transporter [Anaerosphaera multitolerans]